MILKTTNLNWFEPHTNLPEVYIQHNLLYVSEQCLLDLGDGYHVSRYFKEYSDGYHSSFKEGWLYIEDPEIVESWAYIK